MARWMTIIFRLHASHNRVASCFPTAQATEKQDPRSNTQYSFLGLIFFDE